MTDMLKNFACAAALTTACIGFIWSQNAPDSTTLKRIDIATPPPPHAGQVERATSLKKSQDTKPLVEHNRIQNRFRVKTGSVSYRLNAQ